MTHNEETNQLIKRDPELTQILESADKHQNSPYNCITYVQKVKLRQASYKKDPN